ncbi:MAG: Phosphoenolpyruvate carboxykinase [Thermomicrobiales bacterium]|nr:Phosphoenolpyruvate carboxykinase [Thermomicrobiales bacterium]
MGRVKSVSASRSAVTLVIEEANSEPHADDRPVKRELRRTAKAEHRDLAAGVLIEHAIHRGEGRLADSGALVVETGVHTGRSPADKFIVRHGDLADDIWWGSVNQPMSPDAFARFHADVVDHLAGKERYLMNLSAGADPEFNLPVRVVTDSAWSALFARNLFLPGRRDESSGTEGWTVLHAPELQADPSRHETASATGIAIDFEWRRVVIAGTQYAGEIKKAIFTVMQGSLPRQGVATMHCSANEGRAGSTALFFGLSGTGKTTLSTDPQRRLIGDDEHGWSERGIFNFENGSYAKTIGLSAEAEPDIFRAAQRFGSVLENVVLDPDTRRPRFDDDSLTENTRAAYPLAFLDPEAGGVGNHPSKILFLSADAFGVLPPVARLSRDQALYWFLSGYTAKLAGTERGVTTPSATFSACFGAPFLPLPPMRYASLFGERLDRHGSEVWLVNTGWTGGPYGTGKRMPIDLTRAVVAAILDGSLDDVPFDADPVFGFAVPRSAPGIPGALLRPRDTWPDAMEYDSTAARLARDLAENFAEFSESAPVEIRTAGPVSQ